MMENRVTDDRPPARNRWGGVLSLGRLALVTVVLGIVTGLAVMLLVWIVHTIEYLVWGHGEGEFLDGLAYPGWMWLPLVSVTAAGVIAALGWYALRRWGRRVSTVEDGVAGKPMPPLETLVDTVLQVTSVALGASIGKEVAPRELAAMAGSKIVRWTGLDAEWRRILIASAAGAGLAAVYNVPLGGALFALEILLARFSIRAAVAALSVSAVATLVARPLVPDQPLYHVPAVELSASLLVAAVVIGPLMGLGASSFLAATKRLAKHRPTGWRLLVVLPLTFAAVGLVGVFFPLILGNGRALAQAGFDVTQPALMLLLLAVLKHVATTVSLGAGAIGGTLQPSVAIGSALGAAAAIGWGFLWPGADATALAIVGAAAFLAANMRAPFTAIALVIEFTGTGFDLIVPIFLAVAGSLGMASLLRPRGLSRFAPVDPSRE
jgi:H+/Cl- antiporter ClcA